MFRTEFPRLYELKDLIVDPTSPDAYFRNFESQLQSSDHIKNIYRYWETTLDSLDSEAWDALKAEAAPHLTRRDLKGRGWQSLFDILNQANAYNYLVRLGCTELRFIPRTTRRTPDLEGTLNAGRVLCEVKTVNISDEEVRARKSTRARSIPLALDQGFFRKLGAIIKQAKEQMDVHDPTFEARHLVYVSPRFDEFFGELKEDYFRAMDKYLLEHSVSGIEIIVHNAPTAFHCFVSMKAAVVDNAS